MTRTGQHRSVPLACVVLLASVMGCASGGGGGGGQVDGPPNGDDGPEQVGQPGPVVISEFLAVNQSGLQDEDGEFSDWIEVHNTGDDRVELGGWSLTDDPEELAKWVLPDVALGGGEYLIVFASGKDRTSTDGGDLHANFGLDAAGDYLALIAADGATVIHEFAPAYPQQYADVSYGLDGAEHLYFTTPTPGSANAEGVTEIDVPEDTGSGEVDSAEAPEFSHQHGFYEAALDLAITSQTEGATVRYTLDGSAPSDTTGQVYGGPIAIGTTTCVRAAVFAEGIEPSTVITQTYIFADDVLNQPSNPEGFPDTWGWDEAAEPPEWTAADYEMDPAVVNATPLTDDEGDFDLKDALLDIPTMSLVMDMDDLFDQSPEAEAGGIYANPWQDGVDWERPGSIELIYPDGSEGFQETCGVRLYGGMGRSPWAKKHTFRLLFKKDYGSTKLEYPLFGEEAADEFDTVILRANFNDSWTMLWDAWKLERIQLVRDEWMRSSQLAMGSVGSHGMFVHLYLNGLYWGLYNPVERPDASFSASYRGGDKEEWDALHDGDPVDGTADAWQQAQDLANTGLSSNEAYQRIQGNNADGTPNADYENLLDVQNLADYMLLNFHAGMEDWDLQNWYAGRRQTQSDGYQMYVWDGEISHLSLEGNDLTGLNNEGSPSGLFHALTENTEFRVLLADRVYHHFFNDGSLTAENAGARYEALTDLIDRAVVAESARWGDTVRSPAYTRDEEWSTERDWMLQEYFPQRTDIVLGFLRNAGLYPTIEAAAFSVGGTPQYGGVIQAGESVTITAASGTVWYTLDGTDPRQPATAVASPRQVEGDTVLVAQGATWQYLDDGSDPGPDWLIGSVAWSSGPAQLGYGDGDESTVISCGDSPQCDSDNHITSYFRHSFEVADASQHTALTLRLLRDDGAVVYLNGQEIVRSNLDAAATINPGTLADDAAETESTWLEFTIDPAGVLADGQNILAAEVHQTSATSSDVSFDLELRSGEGDSAGGEPEDRGSEEGVESGPPQGIGGSVAPEAIEYTGPLTVSGTAQLKARVLDGGEWSALADATFVVQRAPELLINEFMASNVAALEDTDGPAGEFDDWIEIHNPGDEEIELGGLYLTDDLDEPDKWQIPGGVTIAARGYLVIWADRDTDQGDRHADFELSADGEAIGLFGSDGLTEIDSITFDEQTADVSYGRSPDGGETWVSQDSPTPGSANGAPAGG